MNIRTYSAAARRFAQRAPRRVVGAVPSGRSVNGRPTLTVRRWDAHDGDPSSPQRVLGVPVDRLLAERPDAPGALVALQDRRLALTGPIAAIGHHRTLRTYVRGRARTKDDKAYRTWLAEVSEVLERMRPESQSR